MQLSYKRSGKSKLDGINIDKEYLLIMEKKSELSSQLRKMVVLQKTFNDMKTEEEKKNEETHTDLS